ncbi:armadillo-type protein [Cytidiella melzeri]|nr:armadillo-type protein [Cytidiella melzeri]
MPREHRKRGKKHKKRTREPSTESTTSHIQSADYAQENVEAGPSWIVSHSSSAEVNAEAPFGYVDSEVKAYFRTVDAQIREWQDGGHTVTEDADMDPNEDRRLFFVAALTEMSGKEKELATDPDCSNILERMAYSMDDFARRVFMDRLTGSYKVLVKHRFASHVCQTFMEVAADTIARECKGILPPIPEASENGELLMMKALVLDACEELLPDVPSLIMDPFASHVLRALLAVLSPALFPPDHKSNVRSRRSAAHKARQGPKISVFAPNKENDNATTKLVPVEFKSRANQFVTRLREALGGNEVRALAASQVASPLLQMLLEIEIDQGLAFAPDSLADRVLDGLITRIHEDSSDALVASDYVGTLLRDPTSSHLLETLVAKLPDEVFAAVWRTYFQSRLSRLAVHPVANFVVAKALQRASEQQLAEACVEIEGVSGKIYKSSRTGVFRALIERAGSLRSNEELALKIIYAAAEVTVEEADGQRALVPCLLRVITAEEYTNILETQPSTSEKQAHDVKPRRRGHVEPSEDPSAIKTQGAVLLQSMLRLPPPHHQAVLDSIYAQPMDELIAIAHDVTSSRVLDAVLQSINVTFKEKRKFVMHFIGHYHALVDDRIGSRVGDNCWAFADPYLREKIARSLIPHERTLVGSFYGKFFARNLNLFLLKRDPEQWKAAQSKSKTQPDHTAKNSEASQLPPAATPTTDGRPESAVGKKQGNRKSVPDDEIDQLFEAKLGKMVKKAALKEILGDAAAESVRESAPPKKRRKGDVDEQHVGLRDIMGAIRAAPKGDDNHRTKKTKR